MKIDTIYICIVFELRIKSIHPNYMERKYETKYAENLFFYFKKLKFINLPPVRFGVFV